VNVVNADKPTGSTPVPASSWRDGASPIARTWTTADAIYLLLLAVVSAVPRLANLLGLDPFIDEVAWTDWAVRQFEWTSPRTWMIPVLTDGRPPLFVWLTAPMATVVDNGFLASRLVSAVAGILSTLLLYLLGRDLVSRPVGFVAGLLWSFSPFSVFFARVAADDMLLTLTAILVTWASVRLARRPNVSTGLFCGASLGLAALAKTSGVLLAVAPILAILLLGQLRDWRSYVRALSGTFVGGLAVSSPLLLGIAPLFAQAALHTGSKSSSDNLLAANASLALYWLDVLVGTALPTLAVVGVLLALVQRRWGLVCAALIGAFIVGVMLAITSPLFSRYLLFGVFPAYLLAAFVLDRAGRLAGQVVARSVRAGPLAGRAALGVQAAVLAVSVGAVALERGQLLTEMIREPSLAGLPDTERFRYVEQWFAGHGLGRIVAELRARGANDPVTLLVSPPSRENRVLLPHSALRFYLRDDPRVRIVDAPPLFRAQDLRELRRIVREGPTYLAVNGSYTPAPGMPDEIPSYTRQLERRIQQDFPGAQEILRIPRPTAPNWLSLYRLDASD
jgi:4-amino-4-deoxy-L-arabinose transferase-like glycosyltransferase